MKSKKEVAAFLKSVNVNGFKDELAIEAYCRRIGYRLRFKANPKNTQIITFEQFQCWIENNHVSPNDVIVTKDGVIGIVKDSDHQTAVLGAYINQVGEFYDSNLTVRQDCLRLASKSEKLTLQRALYEKKVAWSKHKMEVVERLIPAHNQQLRITLLGEKIGLGVLREIKDNGDVIMYCFMKFNEPVRYSLHEMIGKEYEYQFEEINSPERKIFAEGLNSSHKLWNGRLKRIEPLNFRGNEGDYFAFINNFWEIEVSQEEKRQKNLILFKSSNYFRNKENCQEIVEIIKSERKRYPIQNRATQGAIYYFINENWEIQKNIENNKPKDNKLHSIGNYFRVVDIPKSILDVVIEKRKKQLVNSFFEVPKLRKGLKPKSLKTIII